MCPCCFFAFRRVSCVALSMSKCRNHGTMLWQVEARMANRPKTSHPELDSASTLREQDKTVFSVSPMVHPARRLPRLQPHLPHAHASQ